ncbi:hypothetical protein G7Y89_g9989 [Cudoniella acicularis]|uniref:C2H2-type domain-containing protein n=1 Tax=Cudoniella acicularis TaxID=354080 RepID=A0A8H4RGB8_9HELO|nr:hypothetical protein G7Y89_g9989 [Cudoniella acicularis]
MDSKPADSAISDHTITCLHLFQKLSSDDARHSQIILKFRDWSGSIGAHRRGRISLDERLRDASSIRRLVIQCLEDIEEALLQVLDTKTTTPEDPASVGHPDQPESMEEQALESLFSSAMVNDPIRHINAMIDILFRITTTIRTPFSADRYENAKRVDLKDGVFFQKEDDRYLTETFPSLHPQLKKRILAGILERRRFLQYTLEHHYKLTSGLDALDSLPDGDGEASAEAMVSGYPESVASGMPSNISASNILAQDWPAPGSETSSLSSVSTSGTMAPGRRFKVPPFPSTTGPKLCPCCYLLVTIEAAKTWEKHIYADMRSYVCTFPECTHDPSKLYSRRSAWFDHELAFHRRQWNCITGCSKIFSTRSDFRTHLSTTHGDLTDKEHLLSLLKGRELSPNAQTSCPFCKTTIKSRRRIKSHIGNHHQQVALFVLSSMRPYADDSDDELDTESDEVSDNMSNDAQVDQPKENVKRLSPHEDIGERSSVVVQVAEPMNDADFFLPPKSLKAPPKNRNDAPRVWILMPNFTYSPEGHIKLGDVIVDPWRPHQTLAHENSPLPANMIQTSYKPNFIMTEDDIKSSIKTFEKTFSRNIKNEKTLTISAHLLQTMRIQPNFEYIESSLKNPMIVDYLASKKFPASRWKLYMITGLRIAHGLKAEQKRESKYYL